MSLCLGLYLVLMTRLTPQANFLSSLSLKINVQYAYVLVAVLSILMELIICFGGMFR
jgi:hypothetical protein